MNTIKNNIKYSIFLAGTILKEKISKVIHDHVKNDGKKKRRPTDESKGGVKQQKQASELKWRVPRSDRPCLEITLLINSN